MNLKQKSFLKSLIIIGYLLITIISCLNAMFSKKLLDQLVPLLLTLVGMYIIYFSLGDKK